jgi:hypothetical protein
MFRWSWSAWLAVWVWCACRAGEAAAMAAVLSSGPCRRSRRRFQVPTAIASPSSTRRLGRWVIALRWRAPSRGAGAQRGRRFPLHRSQRQRRRGEAGLVWHGGAVARAPAGREFLRLVVRRAQAVLPLDSDLVAVSMYGVNVSPRHGGMALLHAGVVRPVTRADTGSDLIAFDADGRFVHGFDTESSEFGLRRSCVLPDGLREEQVVATDGRFAVCPLDRSPNGLVLDTAVYRPPDPTRGWEGQRARRRLPAERGARPAGARVQFLARQQRRGQDARAGGCGQPSSSWLVGQTGFVSSGEKQVAFAKIDLRPVDAATGRVCFATSSAGEASIESTRALRAPCADSSTRNF